MASMGMRVARKLFRNASTTSTTSNMAMKMVWVTSSMEFWMNVEES